MTVKILEGVEIASVDQAYADDIYPVFLHDPTISTITSVDGLPSLGMFEIAPTWEYEAAITMGLGVLSPFNFVPELQSAVRLHLATIR